MSNDIKEQFIDLSARTKLKIRPANLDEIEQSKKSFQKLNKSIVNDIKIYNEQLDSYIAELQKKRNAEKAEEQKNKGKILRHLQNKLYQLLNFRRKYVFIGMLSSVICLFLIIYTREEKLFPKIEIADSIFTTEPWNLGNEIEEEKNTIDLSPIWGESAVEVRHIEFLPSFTQVSSILYGYSENGFTNDLLHLDRNVIVQDLVTRQEIPIEQLAGQKILSSYEENDKKVYFLGQYSDVYNWDGDCITNVYNPDGTLYGICEYNFKDGESLTCKSLYNTGQDKIWLCVDRTYYGDESYGESIRYTFEYDTCKTFSDNDVKYNDILYIEDFLARIDATTCSYYKGWMSNGKYNDMSGDAFLVIYFEPDVIKGFDVPIIKTLYNGRFQNGKFSEENYDSWYITRDVDTAYMYYKGGFFEGDVQHKDRDKESFINDLSHEQIEEYLKEYGFSKYSGQFITEYENTD